MLTAVCADVFVRVVGIGPRVYAPRRYEPGRRVPYAQLAGGPIVYQPNSHFASVYDDYRDDAAPQYASGAVEYVINEDGFRGPPTTVAKSAGMTRIVCLGDSVTFGEGVEESASYPRIVERMLNEAAAARRYEVINAGVQGHGTIDEYLYFKMHVARFKPDVVTLGFFLNDAMDGAQTIRQNEEWTREWELSALSRFSRLAEIVERGRIARRLQEEYFAAVRESFRSPRWDLCQRALSDFQHASIEGHFRFVMLIFPVPWSLDEDYPFNDIHGRILEACRTRGIESLDLIECWRGVDASDLWVHPTDHHPNARAHALAARRIASVLMSQ